MNKRFGEVALGPARVTRTSLPAKAKLISVTEKGGAIVIFFVATDNGIREERTFEKYETGDELYVDFGFRREYVGTLVLNSLRAIHIYEKVTY